MAYKAGVLGFLKGGSLTGYYQGSGSQILNPQALAVCLHIAKPKLW